MECVGWERVFEEVAEVAVAPESVKLSENPSSSARTRVAGAGVLLTILSTNGEKTFIQNWTEEKFEEVKWFSSAWGLSCGVRTWRKGGGGGGSTKLNRERLYPSHRKATMTTMTTVTEQRYFSPNKQHDPPLQISPLLVFVEPMSANAGSQAHCCTSVFWFCQWKVNFYMNEMNLYAYTPSLPHKHINTQFLDHHSPRVILRCASISVRYLC